jgi:hypothetical protein
MRANDGDEGIECELAPIPAEKSSLQLGANAETSSREPSVTAVMSLDESHDTRRHFSR